MNRRSALQLIQVNSDFPSVEKNVECRRLDGLALGTYMIIAKPMAFP
jgi:hypothetical protein